MIIELEDPGNNTLWGCELKPQEYTTPKDWMSFFALGKYSAGASPTAITHRILFLSSTATTARIKNARLIAIKASADDKFASNVNEASVATSAWSTHTTLTFTPASQGDYLVIGAAAIACDTAGGRVGARLNHATAGTTYGGRDCYVKSDYERRVFAVSPKINLSAVSNTFTLQYHSPDNSTGVTCAYSAILALRLDGFEAAYTNQDFNASPINTAQTGYQDALTVSATPAAVAHLIVATSHQRIASNTISRLPAADRRQPVDDVLRVHAGGGQRQQLLRPRPSGGDDARRLGGELEVAVQVRGEQHRLRRRPCDRRAAVGSRIDDDHRHGGADDRRADRRRVRRGDVQRFGDANAQRVCQRRVRQQRRAGDRHGDTDDRRVHLDATATETFSGTAAETIAAFTASASAAEAVTGSSAGTVGAFVERGERDVRRHGDTDGPGVHPRRRCRDFVGTAADTSRSPRASAAETFAGASAPHRRRVHVEHDGCRDLRPAPPEQRSVRFTLGGVRCRDASLARRLIHLQRVYLGDNSNRELHWHCAAGCRSVHVDRDGDRRFHRHQPPTRSTRSSPTPPRAEFCRQRQRYGRRL